MPRTLRVILMRHAKSAWNTDAPSDHARPLNKRGRRDAPKVGAHLRELGWVPDAVLSSDSGRTTETFERMRDALGFEGSAELHHDLYHAGVPAVRRLAGALTDEVGTALLLGHNPGWEEVLSWLSDEDEPMKTATCALLEVDAQRWPEALSRAGEWTLRAMIYPREL